MISRLASLFVAALLLAGCGKEQAELHIYNWADYMSPELIGQFEKENHCRVVLDTFDSNESMLAKLEAGATGYDLIFPSNYYGAILHRKGMLQALQKEKLPNLKNIDPAMLKKLPDPACDYSVPYMISVTGMAWNKRNVTDFKPTWQMFTRGDLKGRVTLLDDKREVLGAALKSLGYSINTTNETEIAAAEKVVIGWKKNIAKFDNEQYKNGIANGEFNLVMGYSGDLMQVVTENDQIGFAVPEEGVAISCDLMAIPKGAKEVDLAHKFINFMHEPAHAAANTEFVLFLCPNRPAYDLMSAEIRGNPGIFVPQAILDKSEMLDDVGDDQVKYNRAWDRVKAAE